MMNRIKGLSAAAIISALMLVSCTAEFRQVSPSPAIGYSAYLYKPSKAAITTSTYPHDGENFGIYSVIVSSGTWAANGASGTMYIEDAECSFNSTENIWVSDPEAFWPLSGSLTFVAYSPYSADASYTISSKTLTVTDFEVAEDQDELLYTIPSDAANQTENTVQYTDGEVSSGDYTGVPIKFRHALSLVTVKIKLAEDYNATIKLTDATLEGLKDKATMTLVDSGTPSWSSPSEDVDDITLCDADTVLSTTAASLLSSYLVMPQTLTANQQVINLKYDVYLKLDGENLTKVEDAVEATVSLNANISAFEPGKSYVLTLVLSQDYIELKAHTTDWIQESPIIIV